MKLKSEVIFNIKIIKMLIINVAIDFMSKLSHLTILLPCDNFLQLDKKKKESVKASKGFLRKQWTQVTTL
jgi:hypothetical protein